MASTTQIQIRLTVEQKSMMERKASGLGLPVAAWLRMLAAQAPERVVPDGRASAGSGYDMSQPLVVGHDKSDTMTDLVENGSTLPISVGGDGEQSPAPPWE